MQAVTAGRSGGGGEEAFDFVICTADWFDKHASDPFVLGRHYLFVKRYDYSELVRFVVEFCSTCNAETWAVVAAKVGRLGKWEFEDYRDAVIGSD